MQFIIPILLLLSAILPTVNIGIIPIRVEDIFLVYYLAYPINLKHIAAALVNNKVTLSIQLFIVINIISLLLIILAGYNVGIRDINTIFLYIKSLLFLLLGIFIGNRVIKFPYNYILMTISFGFVISSLISIVQYYNIFNFGRQLYLYYGNFERIQYGITRAVGTFGNPNYAAYFHCIGVIFIIFTEFKQYYAILLKFVCLLILSIGIILTFSRTGIISLTLILLLWLFSNVKLSKFALLLLIFITIGFKYSDVIINSRFVTLINNEGTNSIYDFGGRLDIIWKDRFQSFQDNPFIGRGPGKNMNFNSDISLSLGNTLYDNSYLLLLNTSGLLGLGVYLSFLAYCLTRFLKFYTIHSLYKCGVMLILLTLVFYFTTDLIWNINYVFYFYFISGLMLSKFKIN